MTSPQFSPEERKRAEQIYNTTKWGTWLGLGSVSLGVYVAMLLLWKNDSRWLAPVVWSFLFGCTLWMGEVLGRKRVRDAKLALEETRSLVLFPLADVHLEDEKPISRLRYMLSRASFGVFVISWALLFELFQFHVLGSTWRLNTNGYFLGALVAARIIWQCYEKFTQDHRLAYYRLSSDRRLEGIAWSQVEEVEEILTYDLKGAFIKCCIVFRGPNQLVVDTLEAHQPFAAEVMKKVEDKLRGEDKISSA